MEQIIYASFQCSEIFFESIFRNCENKPGQAVQKFNRLMIEGLAQHDGIQVYSVTELPITEHNFKRIFFAKEKETVNRVNYIYISLINIHFLKDCIAVFSSFLTCTKLLCNKRKTILIADILNAPVALGARIAAYIFRKKYIAVVTDLPEYVYTKRDFAYKTVSEFLISSANAYVLLTEQMGTKVNTKVKKKIVIEGMVDFNENEKIDKLKEKSECILLYTGSIHRKYGIENLVYGFIEARLSNAELHIYGDGDYAKELKTLCDRYKSVKYFGNVLSSIAVEKQREATLLINPRPTNADYTKYSFPSKNMEYMASGVPLLTTNLPGMPKEYREYVYLLEDESIDGIKNKLMQIMNKDKNELRQKGILAREFVFREKNNIIQAQKIINMCNE